MVCLWGVATAFLRLPRSLPHTTVTLTHTPTKPNSWNITDTAKLGVVGVYTPDGLTADAWREGLATFAAAAAKRAKRRK